MNSNINAPNHNLIHNTRRLICNHDSLMVGSTATLLSYRELKSPQQENRTAALITRTRRKMRQMMRSLSKNEEIHNIHTTANIMKTPYENTPSVLMMSTIGSGSSTSISNSSVALNESNAGELSPLNFVSPEDNDDGIISSSTMSFVRSLVGGNRQEEQELMEIVNEILSLDEVTSIPARIILG